VNAQDAASFVAHCVEHMTEWLGPPRLGPIHLRTHYDGGPDGYSRPGFVSVRRSLLEQGDTHYLELLLAHEAAHHWWGLGPVRGRVFCEPMAEFSAWRLLSHMSLDYQRHVSLSMGRVARLTMTQGSPVQRAEDRALGRDPLAILGWWRTHGGEADHFLSALMSGSVEHVHNGHLRWFQRLDAAPDDCAMYLSRTANGLRGRCWHGHPMPFAVAVAVRSRDYREELLWGTMIDTDGSALDTSAQCAPVLDCRSRQLLRILPATTAR
jgi:hypothetical protein